MATIEPVLVEAAERCNEALVAASRGGSGELVRFGSGQALIDAVAIHTGLPVEGLIDQLGDTAYRLEQQLNSGVPASKLVFSATVNPFLMGYLAAKVQAEREGAVDGGE
jgi:hypothetical protein